MPVHFWAKQNAFFNITQESHDTENEYKVKLNNVKETHLNVTNEIVAAAAAAVSLKYFSGSIVSLFVFCFHFITDKWLDDNENKRRIK